MRVHKYRAWHIEWKTMSMEPFYLGQNPQFKIHDSYGAFSPSPRATKIMEVMEYVGFHDKNTKEMCEGDIIEFINHDLDEDTVVRGYIDFLHGTFIVRRANGDPYRFWSDGDHEWYSIEGMRYWPEEDKPRILGTKYENPELLEKTA